MSEELIVGRMHKHQFDKDGFCVAADGIGCGISVYAVLTDVMKERDALAAKLAGLVAACRKVDDYCDDYCYVDGVVGKEVFMIDPPIWHEFMTTVEAAKASGDVPSRTGAEGGNEE